MAERLGEEPEKRNFPDNDALKSVLDAIFREQTALDKKAEAYKKDTETNRANITSAIKNAKNDHGIPAKTLRFMLAEEKVRRSLDKKKKDLPEDDHDYLLAIKDALGSYADTPLGKAVLAEVKAEEE